MIEIFKGPDLPQLLFIWLARDADWSKASWTWWLSSSGSHSPQLITTQLLTCALPLTGVTSQLPGWCILPTDQGEPLLCDLKCPWCQMFRDEGINYLFFLHSAYPNTTITIKGWDRCILFIFICFSRVSRHILIFCSWLNGLPCVYIIKSDLLHWTGDLSALALLSFLHCILALTKFLHDY